jgi:hypothetical protein
LDPVGIRNLVPISNPHRFDALLQDLTGGSGFARHFDRSHRSRINGEKGAEKEGGDGRGHHGLNERKSLG